MKVESAIALITRRDVAALLGGCAAVAAAATLLLAPPPAPAADPPGASAPAAKKDAPATVKSVPGSTVKRITLTPRAAERLGIAMGEVSEVPIVRKRMVGGLVVQPVEKQLQPKPAGGGFGGFAAAPVPKPVAVRASAPLAGDARVLVALTPAEWEGVAKDKPARLLPLPTRDTPGKPVLARPSGMGPVEDAKRSMLHVYYLVPGKEHGLTLNQRMRVELEQSGSEDKRKVVPYGAVYYDAKGTPWVYVTPEPLAFERQRIGVERVVGDLAVLSDGPPAGTKVVVVGAAMLFGVEVFGK